MMRRAIFLAWFAVTLPAFAGDIEFQDGRDLFNAVQSANRTLEGTATAEDYIRGAAALGYVLGAYSMLSYTTDRGEGCRQRTSGELLALLEQCLSDRRPFWSFPAPALVQACVLSSCRQS